MDIKAQFEDAQARVKNLSQAPSNESLLLLYAYYKQASVGDISGKRPGMLDMKGRAKFDAWSKVSGITTEQAMEKYVKLVDSLGA